MTLTNPTPAPAVPPGTPGPHTPPDAVHCTIDGFDVASRLANGAGPAIVLVSSRDSSDFGPLVSRSGARGFVPKAELSGARIHELL